MTDEAGREPARDPQDLERMVVSRERVGDVDGMTALYEPHAVIDCGEGRLVVGRQKRSGSSTLDWWRWAENLSSESNARRSSVETWHSLQRAVPMAA